MIPLTNHDFQWGRSEVVIIYPDSIASRKHRGRCGSKSLISSPFCDEKGLRTGVFWVQALAGDIRQVESAAFNQAVDNIIYCISILMYIVYDR